ncbi:cytochrome c oxidase subunit 5A, mitochondrial [Galendromus occidentalis]|uniref:Cytochrome c oxidase subunit 5A, mitochondrial n=1 Tax=Galendromus occidentalis TaxID=34638 RepID=A0AAJ6VVY9_9ACAR|nr:cytochrome c oxidase subunit 5A, mitochondrial [Galendromus occidentalis]
MLRSAARFGVLAVRQGVLCQRVAPAIGARSFSAAVEETDAEIDAHFEAYFKRADLDPWLLRKGLYDIHRRDMIPNPEICKTILKACRKLDDYALTTRFLEALKFKCRGEPALLAFILKEIKPTMDELGVSTLEEMGYDKPELWLEYPDDRL